MDRTKPAIIYVCPDGRFGCCVHPKDGGHRKRIFALAGEKLTSTHKPRGFTVKVAKMKAPTPVESVKQCLELLLGTLGTGDSMSRAYEREGNPHHIYKDKETDVPSVPIVKAESVAETDLLEAKSGRPPARTVRLSAHQLPWLGVAERVLAHEFERADDSTIESVTIGLRGIPHPICQKALARLRPNKEKPRNKHNWSEKQASEASEVEKRAVTKLTLSKRVMICWPD
jgi:hypothetical protein